MKDIHLKYAKLFYLVVVPGWASREQYELPFKLLVSPLIIDTFVIPHIALFEVFRLELTWFYMFWWVVISLKLQLSSTIPLQ